MGLWSSIKKAAKKVWRAVKSAGRQIARVVAEAAGRILGVADLLVGFLAWPPKKLRVRVRILTGPNGPVALPADLTPSINYAKQVYKDRFNVKLLPHPGPETPFVEVLPNVAPAAALDVHCNAGAWKEEFGEAGEYFAQNLAGLVFPVTAFGVHDVDGKKGCSLGPLTDYVTLDIDGVKSFSTLAHEIGHACGLWHSGSQSNLMWPEDNRGNNVAWWQKNLFRSSRHVVYW